MLLPKLSSCRLVSSHSPLQYKHHGCSILSSMSLNHHSLSLSLSLSISFSLFLQISNSVICIRTFCVPSNVQSTFLKSYLLLAYPQFVVDSVSCRKHINMCAEGRGKSLVNFRQVACSLGLVLVLFYYSLFFYCFPFHLYLSLSLF